MHTMWWIRQVVQSGEHHWSLILQVKKESFKINFFISDQGRIALLKYLCFLSSCFYSSFFLPFVRGRSQSTARLCLCSSQTPGFRMIPGENQWRDLSFVPNWTTTSSVSQPQTDFNSLTHKHTTGNNVFLQFICLWNDSRFLLTAVALLSTYSIHLLLKSSGIVGKLPCVCLDFSSKQ